MRSLTPGASSKADPVQQIVLMSAADLAVEVKLAGALLDNIGCRNSPTVRWALGRGVDDRRCILNHFKCGLLGGRVVSPHGTRIRYWNLAYIS